MRSFTIRVLLGLAAGLASGILLSVASPGLATTVSVFVEPVGTLFTNAIRMTVIPLVVASLIAGVASIADARAVGRLGGRAVASFLVFVSVATLFGAATAYPLMGLLRIDPEVAESLRAAVSGPAATVAAGAQAVPSGAKWIVDLVPVNPFKAASDGAILPLIVFGLAFALGLTRIEADRRVAVVRVVQGVADAMLVVVRWVLRFTPVGVFALALPLAARMGAAAAGALAYYMGLLSLISAAFIALLYPVAAVLGGVKVREFARAAAPGQAVAFTSRSSLAALPACLDGLRRDLRLPDAIGSFFLPFAASMFRVGGAIAQVVTVLFLARLYAVELTLPQVAMVVLTVIPTSFTIPGIPAGAIITMTPVLAAVGLPVEGIGIVLGVDTFSDMFRTMANVTGWMTVGTILGRRRDGPGVTAGP